MGNQAPVHVDQYAVICIQPHDGNIVGRTDIITVNKLLGTHQVEMFINRFGITDDRKAAAHGGIVASNLKSIDTHPFDFSKSSTKIKVCLTESLYPRLGIYIQLKQPQEFYYIY